MYVYMYIYIYTHIYIYIYIYTYVERERYRYRVYRHVVCMRRTLEGVGLHGIQERHGGLRAINRVQGA